MMDEVRFEKTEIGTRLYMVKKITSAKGREKKMKNFKVTQEQRGDVILFKLQGYLNDLGGEEIERVV